MLNRDLTLTDVAFDEADIPATNPDTLQGARLDQVSIPMLLGAARQATRADAQVLWGSIRPQQPFHFNIVDEDE